MHLTVRHSLVFNDKISKSLKPYASYNYMKGHILNFTTSTTWLDCSEPSDFSKNVSF